MKLLCTIFSILAGWSSAKTNDLLLNLIMSDQYEYNNTQFAFPMQFPNEGLKDFVTKLKPLLYKIKNEQNLFFSQKSLKDFPTFGKCQLSMFESVCLFESSWNIVNKYLKNLVSSIPNTSTSLPTSLTLSRFDLFHGHVFLNDVQDFVGILFHAEEYPEDFPTNLGFCAANSTLPYEYDRFRYRNLIFVTDGVKSNFVMLDADDSTLVGSEYICDPNLFDPSLCPYLRPGRTVRQDSLGEELTTLYFLPDLHLDAFVFGFQGMKASDCIHKAIT